MKTKKKTAKKSVKSIYEPIGTVPKVGDRTVWHSYPDDVQTITAIHKDGVIDVKGCDRMSNTYWFDKAHCGKRRILKRKKTEKKATGPKVYAIKGTGLVYVVSGRKAAYNAKYHGEPLTHESSLAAWCSEPVAAAKAYLKDRGHQARLVTGRTRDHVLGFVDTLGKKWNNCTS